MTESGPAKSYRPAWWLPGGHAQTIVANLVHGRRGMRLRRQRLTLPDGDFLALDWGPDPGGPIVVILHGLGGGSQSVYARVLMRALHARGFWAGTLHFRGAAGEPNRKPRSYHMGESEDPFFVLSDLRRRYPRRALAAVGISLGGSALLHTLALDGVESKIDCAVAISVPFDLHVCEQRLNRGFSRLYQAYILAGLKRQWLRKCRMLARLDLCSELHTVRCFRDFDARITAPLHGYRDADDYYTRASSLHVLRSITVPTLLLNARDDPFSHPDSLPTIEQISEHIELEFTAKGGHVGFLEASGRRYFERRVPDFIQQHLAVRAAAIPPAPLQQVRSLS